MREVAVKRSKELEKKMNERMRAEKEAKEEISRQCQDQNTSAVSSLGEQPLLLQLHILGSREKQLEKKWLCQEQKMMTIVLHSVELPTMNKLLKPFSLLHQFLLFACLNHKIYTCVGIDVKQ